VGEVNLAYDLQLERWVAVKRIQLEMGETQRRMQLALGEAKRLARLQHPNIVTVYDVLEHRGDILMVMEFVSGRTLEELDGPVTLETFLDITRQALGALGAAHAVGMIHLDIKPTNLMITNLPTGQTHVKLLDFGLATLLEQPSFEQPGESGIVLGSVYTMAPEQLERDPVGIRTDLYSLGCVLYFSLCQAEPFGGDTVEEIIDAHLAHRYVPLRERRPDLPKPVYAWVDRLMARQMADRPESATAALAELLHGLASQRGVPNVRSGRSERSRKETPTLIDLATPHDLRKHLGRTITVRGEVARVWENMPGTARFLNFSGLGHDEFSVVLPLRNTEANFSRSHLDQLVGATVRVTGPVSDFHGAPQIVVESAAQIEADS
jgi:serine/threonine protein kinase